jgi:RNA polymerase sigma-70 factor (ECF subfamily)
MATNHCLNRIRSRGRRAEAPDEAALFAIASQDDLESTSAAGRLLDQLFRREAPNTRALAVLHFVDGLTLEETAAEGGLSISGLRKRFRGLKASLDNLQGVSHVG